MKRRRSPKAPAGGSAARKREKGEAAAASTSQETAAAVSSLAATIRHRVPEDLPEPVKALADRALARAVDVLEGRVDGPGATAVLKAATFIREEVCGPVPRDVKLTGKLSLEQLVAAASKTDGEDDS